MAWANQEIYKEIKKLDTKVLDYFVIDPEWTTDDSEIIDELLLELDRIDQSLLKNVDREDEEVTYKTSKGEGKSTVSEILSQLIFHAGEHRAQIVAALDKHNERSINLDNFSVWSYVNSTK